MNEEGEKSLQDKLALTSVSESPNDTGISDPTGVEIQAILQELLKRQSELEKQRAELTCVRAELQETRDQYLFSYDYAPLGYATLDIQGTILNANINLGELLGTAKPKLIGSVITTHIHPDHLDLFQAHLKNVFNTGVKQKCDLEMKKTDGALFFARLESIAIRDEKGHLSQSQTAVFDISSDKKYEELVHYQSRIIEVSPDAILTTDKDLILMTWNNAAEKLFGWKAEEVCGKQTSPQTRLRILDILTKDEVMQSLIKNGTWIGKGTGFKKDGSVFKALISMGIIWDHDRNFNGIVAIFHDNRNPKEENPSLSKEEMDLGIKNHLEELVHTNHILREELGVYKKEALMAKESEGRNRDLVENIKLGIFRCTPGPLGKFLEVNRAMEDITGYSREELQQMDVCSLLSSDQNQSLFTNDVNITDWKMIRELKLKKKDEGELSVAETIVAIRFDSGAIQYFDGILENITERKQAQEQIQQSLERLQKTIKEIIQAMAYIGEVRDPYTAGHQRRVAQLSIEIAKAMGFNDNQFEGLSMAAFVHDIGKILVPSDILSKPGELTKPEFDMLKDHTRIGYEILKTIEFPWPIAQIVLQHHERMDGSGYPQGLSGDQLLIEAKILAVADVVEAMSSHRPYRPALGIDKALYEINQHRGTLYDANVVDACNKLFTDKGFSLN